MKDASPEKLDIGLSEDEKNDLEKMINEFRNEDALPLENKENESVSLRIDKIEKRLAHLTRMFLNIDKRMKPLYDIIHLSHQKSELMNNRIDEIIDALKKGNLPQ